jgi:hypothetical protein
MDLRFQQRGATGVAFFFCVIPLQADITLPTVPPPQADSQAVRVFRGDRATIPLRGHHGGSGAITFWIVERPQHGTLSDLRPLGDNRATIVYQHDGAEPPSTDRFSYLVKTSADDVSSPADVKIFVEESPARLQVPARIEFDKVMAGESMMRHLAITNEGGGVVEGRLAASAPWRLDSNHYRVASGETKHVAVVFRPDEARKFVGQITLVGAGDEQSSVLLEGSAVSPIGFEPAELRIAPPKQKGGSRGAFISLTNRSGRLLKLKFSASRSIEPIADVALAPAQKKEIEIILSPERTMPVHEALIVRGEGFSIRLPVDADALSPEQNPSRPDPSASVSAAPPTPRATATVPISTQQNIVRPEAAASPPPAPPSGSVVLVRAQRMEPSRWELRWARPTNPVAKYRIEERFLALDGAGELQISWRPLPPPEVAFTGDSVTAQVKGLDPRRLHALKVAALGPADATLWESPLVALAPPARQSHRARGWVLIFVIALLILIGLRWRASHASPNDKN